MKLRPGDKITLEVESFTKIASDGDLVLRFKGSYFDNHIPQAAIQHHESAPRPIQVGDKVRWAAGIYIWTVKSIVGDKAWVYTDRADSVINLDLLRREED